MNLSNLEVTVAVKFDSYPFTDSGSDSSPVIGDIRESSSLVSSSCSYCNTVQNDTNTNIKMAFQLKDGSDILKPNMQSRALTVFCNNIAASFKSYIDSTSNLSLVPLISMRELRHSPTTIPIRLIRTTLLSRWLCMPPSIH